MFCLLCVAGCVLSHMKPSLADETPEHPRSNDKKIAAAVLLRIRGSRYYAATLATESWTRCEAWLLLPATRRRQSRCSVWKRRGTFRNRGSARPGNLAARGGCKATVEHAISCFSPGGKGTAGLATMLEPLRKSATKK